MRLIAAFAGWLLAAGLAPGAAEEIDFAHDVAPLLRTRCGECHSRGHSKGGFSFNTRSLLLDSGAVEPGDAAASRLVQLIESTDEDDQMPPADLPRLSPEEVRILRRWIDAGAPWEPGFTFAGAGYDPPLAIREVVVPPARPGRENPIDRILDAAPRAADAPPPEPTIPLADAEFLRRVSLDLIGLPPSEELLERFLGDNSPDKRARVVDELLARRNDYAEHWLTFWNDLLRNDYAGTGFIDGGRSQITGWLYQALWNNTPYDEFVRQLIAPSEESAGFIRGIKWRGNVNASQVRELQFSQNVSQVFLGVNLKCASCHDSFIDRWTLKEAYGLAAIYSERELPIHRCDKPTGETAEAAWLYPELGQVDPQAPQAERLRQLAALITDHRNGRFARTIVNRLWAKLMGRGVVHPVDALHTRPWNEDLLEHLASALIADGYDLKKMLRRIVLSQAYQTPAVAGDLEDLESDAFVFRGPITRRMTAEQYLDAIRMVCGVWPTPDPLAFQKDGRGQGGQLAAIQQALGKEAMWNDRPLRASLTPRDPLQAALGRPHREQVVSARPDLLSTLEAIHLANGQELAELIAAGAAQVLAEQEWTPEALTATIYRRALARDPSPAELAVTRNLLTPLEPTSVEDLLWSVLLLPEFQLLR